MESNAPELQKALKNVDWQQVVLNGGPPCFCIEDGRFCLRAERWGGHDAYHRFISLSDFVSNISNTPNPVAGADDRLREAEDLGDKLYDSLIDCIDWIDGCDATTTGASTTDKALAALRAWGEKRG